MSFSLFLCCSALYGARYIFIRQGSPVRQTTKLHQFISSDVAVRNTLAEREQRLRGKVTFFLAEGARQMLMKFCSCKISPMSLLLATLTSPNFWKYVNYINIVFGFVIVFSRAGLLARECILYHDYIRQAQLLE